MFKSWWYHLWSNCTSYGNFGPDSQGTVLVMWWILTGLSPSIVGQGSTYHESEVLARRADPDVAELDLRNPHHRIHRFWEWGFRTSLEGYRLLLVRERDNQPAYYQAGSEFRSESSILWYHVGALTLIKFPLLCHNQKWSSKMVGTYINKSTTRPFQVLNGRKTTTVKCLSNMFMNDWISYKLFLLCKIKSPESLYILESIILWMLKLRNTIGNFSIDVHWRYNINGKSH